MFPFPAPTGLRTQNNIRELGKHGGFSFTSLKIQHAVDTNARPM